MRLTRFSAGVRTVLENRGYSVTEAEDGGEALVALARNGDFDLMLLDLAMPTLSGHEVLRAARSSLVTSSLPIVVLTAMDQPGLEVQVLEEGADDYLQKPIDPMLLLTRIKAAMRRVAG